MSLAELITYKGKPLRDLEEGKERDFLLRAMKNLKFLEVEIVKEKEALLRKTYRNYGSLQFKSG